MYSVKLNIHYFISNIMSLLVFLDEFTEQFVKLAWNLLSSQDSSNPTYNWVKADAAKASNMKESETLRYV